MDSWTIGIMVYVEETSTAMRWQTMVSRCIAETSAIMSTGSAMRSGLRILMYHSVGCKVRGDGLGIFAISNDLFMQHANILSNEHVVDLSLDAISRAPIVGTHVAITFDDGYSDNLHVAAPILCGLNIPFTVFVTSDFIKDHEPGFMNESELRELSCLPGVSIGAHGCSHRPLTDCSDEELLNELQASKDYIEDVIGKPVDTVAYPHGATDMRVRNAAVQVGYSLGACSYFDINTSKRDRLLLNRCSILSDDTARVLRLKLRGNWDWYRRRMSDPATSVER